MSACADYLTSLRGREACEDAVKWLGQMTLAEAWESCERGDWMLWIAERAGVERDLVVLAACDCAETALVYLPRGEDRPRECIEVTRKFIAGEATRAQLLATVSTAASASYDASSAAYAASAAAREHARLVRARIPLAVIRAAMPAEVQREDLELEDLEHEGSE